MADELDNLVGAVSENEIRRLDTKMRSELLFEVKGISVRIKIQLARRFLHRRQGRGGRPERILVRGKFDDVVGRQAKFPRNFLDRPPRLIIRHVLQEGIERYFGRAHELTRS